MLSYCRRGSFIQRRHETPNGLRGNGKNGKNTRGRGVKETAIDGRKRMGFRSGSRVYSARRRDPMKLIHALAAAAVTAIIVAPANAADISGAGATFPYPIYAKWADAYKKETGIGLNYQSIGSGGGIKQIKAKTVTFGASDAPLPGKELDDSGLVQFPMVMGGIVPVVNVEGIKSGELVLDGPTVARIFLGEIKTWNDPAIAKLNPSAKLPSQP